MSKLNQLRDILVPFQYVSFDIFDTLLFRAVDKPIRIFDVVVQKLKDTSEDSLIDFPRQRVIAENAARKEGWQKVLQDITLDDIYNHLTYGKDTKELLKRTELWCEEHCVLPNSSMVELLHWCKEQGKQVIITTDMYLPRHSIETILSRIGVSYDYLFVSGEVGLTKRTGDLFAYILDYLQIEPQQLVHIGDDPNNDIAIPRRHGIESVQRITPKKDHDSYLPQNQKWGLVEEHLHCLFQISAEKGMGYTVLGPLMADFCQWLHRVKHEEQIERLLFVAREGWLIKQCYEHFYPEETTSTTYAWLNRNVLAKPTPLLMDYLSQLGFGHQTVGLVNNSINGTGQFLIKQQLGKNGIETKVVGLQFVKSKLCETRLGPRSRSFIAELGKPFYYYNDFVRSCFVLEHLLFEPVGTTLRLTLNAEGAIVPENESQRRERENVPVIDELQRQALQFIDDYRNNLNLPLRGIGAELFRSMFMMPQLNDAQLIGNLYDDDTSGDKKIGLPEKPFRWKQIMDIDIKDVLWAEAFFRMHGVPAICIYLYHARLKFRYYRGKLYSLWTRKN